MNTALGLIETNGWVPMVQAADAMAKTADVQLIGWQKVGAGLVTIVVEGDVASVQSAVSAGVVAAKKVGEVVAMHVIPRVDSGLRTLLPLRKLPRNPN